MVTYCMECWKPITSTSLSCLCKPALSVYSRLGKDTRATQAVRITALEAENARLQELLDLYREAVQVDVKISGPEFMGVNRSALWRAWLQDEYRSATKETTIDN